MSGVVVEPRGPCKGTIVWLHGLGADGHDFEPLVPVLELPQIRFVFPNARRMPVTINGGFVMRAWYDILTMERVSWRENGQHIRRSAARIAGILDEAEGPTVLAGFSQGAAMALHVAHRYPRTLHGILALSGYLVLEDTLDAEGVAANAATPMFFGHGTADDVVPIQGGKRAYERFRTGRQAAWHDYPMGHQVSPAEVADIKAWLHARFDESS